MSDKWVQAAEAGHADFFRLVGELGPALQAMQDEPPGGTIRGGEVKEELPKTKAQEPMVVIDLDKPAGSSNSSAPRAPTTPPWRKPSAPAPPPTSAVPSPTTPPLPPPVKRKREVTQDELLMLAAERDVATSNAIPWQQRGPPGPEEGGPSTWRGQQWREGSGRWANRGGANKNFYTEFYPLQCAGHTKAEAYRLATERTGGKIGSAAGAGFSSSSAPGPAPGPAP